MRNFFERINKNLKNNKGFSLVELIIVIAIMAVLIAVLAPQYTKYVERSRVQTDLTALEELRKAVEIATIDPVNVTLATSVTVDKDGNMAFVPATNDIKDDIKAVIGSDNKLDLKSSTAAGQGTKKYTITIATDANGVTKVTTNWNSDGNIS